MKLESENRRSAGRSKLLLSGTEHKKERKRKEMKFISLAFSIGIEEEKVW